MNHYKVISIDMFQTLVDINTRIDFIWRKILGDAYKKEIAEEYAGYLNEIVYRRFHEDVNQLSNFQTLKLIFERYFTEVFQEKKIDFNPLEASRIFASEHNFALPYNDTESFFEFTANAIPICLVSDTDYDMIVDHVQNFKFDKIVISEHVQSYKNSVDGRIFKEVIKYFNVEPHEILHIGDSSSDIIGANRVGIKTCWLNRHGSDWKHEIKPNYEVESLIELADILGIKEN